MVFSPKDIGEFDSIAFLDIDGVCGRVPLKLVGTALPPAIQLNIETLDMDCVYINKVYNYEVIAINRGKFVIISLLKLKTDHKCPILNRNETQIPSMFIDFRPEFSFTFLSFNKT